MDTDMAETVYGSHEDSHVMSERVQSLAASIYKEFERMIKSYDENVVKELMPLVVGILEALDQSYQEKQEVDVELELLRDDNEQLLTQYEREKQLRKASEQKYLEVEDAIEEEQKELQGKVESLESIVRMFELKSKNTQDHVSRLEDKEAEMKKEYNKLHERYTELFRTHMDYMERTKMMMGMDRLVESGSTPRQRGTFQLPNLRAVTPGGSGYIGETPTRTGNSPTGYSITSPGSVRSQDSNTSLRNELRDSDRPQGGDVDANLNKTNVTQKDTKTETAEKGQTTDSVQVTESSTGTKVHSDTQQQHQQQQSQENQQQNHQTNNVTPEPDKNVPANSDKTVELTKTTAPSSGESEKHPETNPADKTETVHDTGVGSPSLESQFFESFEESIGARIVPPAGLDAVRQQSVTSPDLEFYDNTFSNNNATSQPVNISANSVGRNNESSIFDELSADVIGEMDYGVDVTGMGKEVENLILENTELLATKNALNVVKDDLIAKVDELTSEQEILREEITSLQAVKTRLKTRVSELEEEMKKMREELDKKTSASRDGNEAEEDVPMAQRKRFTRVEMARVLMERNQYKERLMELQEAVRWTEMIRASREHPDLSHKQQKKSTIWNFFSNLFNSSNKPNKNKPTASATIRYNAPTTAVQPVGDPNKKQREKYNLGDKAKAYDFMQSGAEEVLNERARKEREKERREQYKQVRAHVKKDDGRMQAYGWSLPAKFTPPAVKEPPSRSHVPVPVPVYCRPLLEKEPGMKVWCAAGVSLCGGKTRDGGSVFGASIFYSNPPLPPEDKKAASKNAVERLDQELQEHVEQMKDMANEKMSSLVWICTTTNEMSRVTVIDANNPADILDSFPVTSSHVLCIATVPGATESDYPANSDIIKCEPVAPPSPLKDTNSATSSPAHSVAADADQSGIGGISFVQCATGTSSKAPSNSGSPVGSPPTKDLSAHAQEELSKITKAVEGLAVACEETSETPRIIRATGSPASSGTSTPIPSTNEKQRLMKEPTSLVKDGISAGPQGGDIVHEEVDKMSSVQATMWMGSQSGSLYVHSAVSQWKKCLHSVKLKDSVLNIVHVKGRVLAALADGTVAVFHRAEDGLWDLTNYHLLDLGRPHHSIRCMCIVMNKHVWCGYRNKIHVVDPKCLKIEKSFDAHPRKESQVRQMSWVGDGVWVSIRLDSTLRLYHAVTHQHLQDVDIEPYVSKMLGTGKLGFSFVRITALLVSCKRLWIGTGNGVIISVPLSEANKQAVSMGTTSSSHGSGGSKPGGVIRVYSDSKTDSVTPGSFTPYCSMAQAQLSFHGHRDAVKFFVAVPGTPVRGLSAASAADAKSSGDDSKTPAYNNMLVMSGGEGYIDFRIGDGDDDDSTSSAEENGPSQISKGDRSHLIVWNLHLK